MATFAPIPRVPGGYRCAVVDPPWSFQDKATRNAPERSAEGYHTLSIEEIAELPVPDLLAPEAIVFLWVPDTHVFEAKWLLDWWGLSFKHFAVWVKEPVEDDLELLAEDWATRAVTAYPPPDALTCAAELRQLVDNAAEPQMGMGNYLRRAHEIAMLTTTIPFHARTQIADRRQRSVIYGKRGRHSAKPETLQDAAERIIEGPYVELFARRRRPGWVCWGDELTEE